MGTVFFKQKYNKTHLQKDKNTTLVFTDFPPQPQPKSFICEGPCNGNPKVQRTQKLREVAGVI